MNTSSSPFPSDRPIDSTGFLAEAADTAKAAENLKAPGRTVVEETNPYPEAFVASMTAYLRMFLRNVTQASLPGLDVTREQLQPLALVLYTPGNLDVMNAQMRWSDFWNRNAADLLRLAATMNNTHLNWVDTCASLLKAEQRSEKMISSQHKDAEEDHLTTYVCEYFTGMLPSGVVVNKADMVPLADCLRQYDKIREFRKVWTKYWLLRGWKLLPKLGSVFTQPDASQLAADCLVDLKDFMSEMNMRTASDNLDKAMQDLRKIAEKTQQTGIYAQPVEVLSPVEEDKRQVQENIQDRVESQPPEQELVYNDLHAKTLAIWRKIMVPFFKKYNQTPRTPAWPELKLVLDLLLACSNGVPSSTHDQLDWFEVMLQFELDGWLEGGFADFGVMDSRVSRITSSSAWLYIHRAYQRLFARMEPLSDPTHTAAAAPYARLNLRLAVMQQVESAVLLWMNTARQADMQVIVDRVQASAIHEVAVPLAQRLSSTPVGGKEELRDHMAKLHNCTTELGHVINFNFDALRIYVS